jgi:DNA-binding GntR family transcriptional regulator
MPVPATSGLLDKARLSDAAYLAIRDAIVDGRLEPGERLNEAELIGWLGVSRTPIREALGRLELSGLVRSKPGRYTMVSPLDLRQTRNAQSVAAAMHELAVREAVPLLTKADLDAMRAANARFRAALAAKDVDAALAADDEFHDVAVTASANLTLRSVLESVTPLLRRMERLQFGSLTGRRSVTLHNRIISLAAAGDAEAAAGFARTNWLTLQPLLDQEIDHEHR